MKQADKIQQYRSKPKVFARPHLGNELSLPAEKGSKHRVRHISDAHPVTRRPISDIPRRPYISVIIPALNEEHSLPRVLNDLPRSIIGEVIVVDNASTDNTAEVARKNGCRVIAESQKGYGQACLAGIRALDPQTEIVVFIDGDRSDHGEQLEKVIEPIIQDGYDFVVGSRALGIRQLGAMTPQAYYGNKLACFLMKLFWGATYTDLGPFRAITLRALEQLDMCDQDFGWTIEMQIKAIENNLKITEVPVNYRRRIGKSKISGTLKGTILAGEKILRTIFKYRFLKKYKDTRHKTQGHKIQIHK